MTIRKLLAALSGYAVGAQDDAECTVSADGQELVIDCGSDIHKLCLAHEVCADNGIFGCRYRDGEKCEGCTNFAAKADVDGVPLCAWCHAELVALVMTRPPLTQQERDALRELLAKATPGPWSSSDDDASPELGDVVIWGPSENWLLNIGNWARQRDSASEIDSKSAARQYCELRDASDAALIVALRNNAAALLDAADRCERLKAALGKMMYWACVPLVALDECDKFEADLAEARAAAESK